MILAATEHKAHYQTLPGESGTALPSVAISQSSDLKDSNGSRCQKATAFRVRSGRERMMTASSIDSSWCVEAIWRYPVKSMIGEELAVAAVTDRGLFGDRAFAFDRQRIGQGHQRQEPAQMGRPVRVSSGLPESANQPGPLSAARITFPDGSSATSAEPDIDDRLSDRLSRPVRLTASVPRGGPRRGLLAGLRLARQPDEVFDFEMPPGTFFDGAPIHLVTTATLHRLSTLAPKSRFDVPRFRPNFVIDCADSTEGFVENDWIGRYALDRW